MASIGDVTKRGTALLLAGLFLVTSVAFSFLVIWQIKQDNQKNKEAEAAQVALEQAQAELNAQQQVQAAETSQEADAAADNQATNNEGNTKLEGTTLKDFSPVTGVTELKIVDLVAGTGAEVAAGDTVTAHYTGALASNGTIFQSSLDSGQPFTSPLANLIKGWQAGIPGMKEGGTRRLIIPAAQAYGAQSQPGIPANSDLVFDIQLISVKK